MDDVEEVRGMMGMVTLIYDSMAMSVIGLKLLSNVLLKEHIAYLIHWVAFIEHHNTLTALTVTLSYLCFFVLPTTLSNP